MKIILKTKNIELTDFIEDMIYEKIGRLEHFISFLKTEDSEIFVEIEKETKHHKKGDIFGAEAIVTLPGKKLVARAKGEDLSQIIGEVKDELEKEIRTYKTKTVDLPRRKYQKTKNKFEY